MTARRPGRRTLRATIAPLLLVATLAGAGCGAEDRQQSTAASASDRVEIVLRPNGKDGQTVRKTVSCSSVTAQCRKLREADFAEPKDGQICAQVYGGPAIATVTGKAGGRAVDTQFTLANSCQIDRWRDYAWLLGDPPGATG